MLDLADLWSRGKPKFETIKVAAKQCPLKGQELQDLAVAAWYEACGVEIPSAEEMAEATQKSRCEQGQPAGHDDRGIAWRNGRRAQLEWSVRTGAKEPGKPRKHDFTNAKLVGVRFQIGFRR